MGRLTDLREDTYKPLGESPYLERFIEAAAEGGSLHAQQVMALRIPDVQRIAMERALLYPEVWQAVSQHEEWDNYTEDIWEKYFTLTMEDLRDGEDIEGAMETLWTTS